MKKAKSPNVSVSSDLSHDIEEKPKRAVKKKTPLKKAKKSRSPAGSFDEYGHGNDDIEDVIESSKGKERPVRRKSIKKKEKANRSPSHTMNGSVDLSSELPAQSPMARR